MFSTFTGNSRRPRNVNLSGQSSNPFSNTSWNPAVVSNATKTVTDAQAERERRQLERQRLKAASRIQRAWRGHHARLSLRELRRSQFDEIYRSVTDENVDQRILRAFPLLLAFFVPRRDDDLQRLFLFIDDCQNANLGQSNLFQRRLSQLQIFAGLLVQALEVLAPTLTNDGDTEHSLRRLLSLINHLASHTPKALFGSENKYCAVLARVCQTTDRDDWVALVSESLCISLSTIEYESSAYDAFAFEFLTSPDLKLLENKFNTLAQKIDMEKLATEIVRGYASSRIKLKSSDELLWLLAHFIDLSQTQLTSTPQLAHLNSLLTQTSALAYEISLGTQTSAVNSTVHGLEPYVSQHILSLINSKGIAKLLHDFSVSLTHSLDQESRGTSLLSGYILTLLRCFPGKADDVRMQLFLQEIPTASGPTPIVKFLWHIMHQTSLFSNLKMERERPVIVLRRYLTSTSSLLKESVEEQEWRVVLLFLELYIFILRLSDDEDFFSGIYPQVLQANSSTGRLRACSLSLGEVTALSTFLKNTAFALHYQVQEIRQHNDAIIASPYSRTDSHQGSDKATQGQSTLPGERPDNASPGTPTKLDLGSLRSIVTTALKMIYERDSRKRFLPENHWLMTSKLENQDFVQAVILEAKEYQERAETSDQEEDGVSASQQDDDSSWYFASTTRRLSRNARIERLRAAQMKERRLADVGAKLEILKHIPFVVPFETRVKIFRHFIQMDRNRREMDSPSRFGLAKRTGIIRRNNIFEDALKEFYHYGEDFKNSLAVTFVDQFGAPEAGIDGGGVTKEFLISVAAEAFGGNSEFDYFTCNERGLLYPNPVLVDACRASAQLAIGDKHEKEAVAALLKRYEFLGRIVGKCLYEGILVDLAFAGFFLLKWPSPGPREENSYKGSINDLQDMDEELYKGLLRLKNYPGDVSELGFDFTITDQVSFPGEEPIRTVTKKLIPNGDQVPVTNDNRLLYISYTARHRLVVQPALQTSIFLRGLRDIIQPSWLSMFNQSELQRLVGGDSKEIDVEDLRRNTVYSGVYEIGNDGLEHPTIQMFWKIMAEFTDKQRRDVLKYVTSTPRAPLLGFSQLKPNFAIRDTGSDEERLPSTSTCINLLKLPIYKKEKTLREKLLYAITSGAGFDLS